MGDDFDMNILRIKKFILQNHLRIAIFLPSLTLIVLSGLSVTGCDPNNAPAARAIAQVERIGRPAINEGLIVFNDNLNAFNSVAPTVDTSATTVLTDADTTLRALGNNATRVGNIVTAFLPDVLIIDSAINSPVGTGAYANGAVLIANGVVRPVAGRKLEDDVIDITLSVLSNGTITTDNTPYFRPPFNSAGDTNTAIGHQFLQGQTTANGTANFPFLANPN